MSKEFPPGVLAVSCVGAVLSNAAPNGLLDGSLVVTQRESNAPGLTHRMNCDWSVRVRGFHAVSTRPRGVGLERSGGTQNAATSGVWAVLSCSFWACGMLLVGARGTQTAAGALGGVRGGKIRTLTKGAVAAGVALPTGMGAHTGVTGCGWDSGRRTLEACGETLGRRLCGVWGT